MITIKQILLSHQNWWNFYKKHQARIRESILINIVRLLSCRHRVRGYKTYACSNPECSHIKIVPFTCKSRGCSSCGKINTERWIQKQNGLLPDTEWQHITFTMPSELWDFFWTNRQLLNKIPALAANILLGRAKKKKILLAIFLALHTFGRSMKRNVHLHISTTRGGISFDGTQWKSCFFKTDLIMKQWRYAIIQLFRQEYKKGKLVIPNSLKNHLNTPAAFNVFLDRLYRKLWVVHAAKPSNNYRYNVSYLARYTKRPPIAQSKLRHYDGQEVVFKFLNHTTQRYQQFRCSTDEFIARFIQHIPDIGFRMIRYYGFLSNRLRGKLLPQVHQLLQQKKQWEQKDLSWAEFMQKEFQINPLKCMLCGSPLVLNAITFGKNNAQLIRYHKELSLLQNIPL